MAAFAEATRILFKIIQTTHHLQNTAVTGGKPVPPASLQRKMRELATLVRPASPTEDTMMKLAGNALNWLHTCMQILEEHYQMILQQLTERLKRIHLTNWPEAFQVATRWARKKFGRKLHRTTLDIAESTITPTNTQRSTTNTVSTSNRYAALADTPTTPTQDMEDHGHSTPGPAPEPVPKRVASPEADNFPQKPCTYTEEYTDQEYYRHGTTGTVLSCSGNLTVSTKLQEHCSDRREACSTSKPAKEDAGTGYPREAGVPHRGHHDETGRKRTELAPHMYADPGRTLPDDTATTHGETEENPPHKLAGSIPGGYQVGKEEVWKETTPNHPGHSRKHNYTHKHSEEHYKHSLHKQQIRSTGRHPTTPTQDMEDHGHSTPGPAPEPVPKRVASPEADNFPQKPCTYTEEYTDQEYYRHGTTGTVLSCSGNLTVSTKLQEHCSDRREACSTSKPAKEDAGTGYPREAGVPHRGHHDETGRKRTELAPHMYADPGRTLPDDTATTHGETEENPPHKLAGSIPGGYQVGKEEVWKETTPNHPGHSRKHNYTHKHSEEHYKHSLHKQQIRSTGRHPTTPTQDMEDHGHSTPGPAPEPVPKRVASPEADNFPQKPCTYTEEVQKNRGRPWGLGD
ncbi:hypothetical protein SKAU_G00088720 [Synaphobranchus kaupii]|uniref:Uncharacterized protein n=1 Tax=Synaphobranchus kaupii TaxID=118154 RepID=A0A9Q1FVY5_SYNKA|nr:hypothetical protein SKAU_G00088720 [Synaphobranchus kaupii]